MRLCVLLDDGMYAWVQKDYLDTKIIYFLIDLVLNLHRASAERLGWEGRRLEAERRGQRTPREEGNEHWYRKASYTRRRF